AQDRVVSVGPPDPDGLLPAMEGAARGAGISATSIREPSDLHPVLAQIPLTVRLQRLALRFAKERGQDPDSVITGPWASPELWSLGAPRR
ncbi:MAG: hypothetical protein M3O88_04370, partial [Actinomycetota bacterium]|nr:hypothetical protein [Actinomycetota bacterium]